MHVRESKFISHYKYSWWENFESKFGDGSHHVASINIWYDKVTCLTQLKADYSFQ